ncbi:MAG: sulfur carrier protein ThiS [Bacteroidota bacterium]
MIIYVNDDSQEVYDGICVDQLLDVLSIDKQQKGIALAVNNQVINKNKWNSTPLKENDRVLIIRASQGG